MTVPLTAPQKTLITTVATDLDAAIAALTAGDSAQFGVRNVLMKLRSDLEQIRIERSQ